MRYFCAGSDCFMCRCFIFVLLAPFVCFHILIMYLGPFGLYSSLYDYTVLAPCCQIYRITEEAYKNTQWDSEGSHTAVGESSSHLTLLTNV